MSWLDGFVLLSLVYVVVGLVVLVRFVANYKRLFGDELTAEDAKLASRASFFLLIPPTVALHELGHAAAIWAYGQEVLGWIFYGYVGAVAHHPTAAGPTGNFVIALAGNLVTLVIGVAAIAIGVKRPGHPTRNILWIDLGRNSLFLVLVFYPALCLFFPGDFVTIYGFDKTPVASGVTAAVHAAVLFFGWRWWQRERSRAILLCSPIAKLVGDAERRLAADPNDVGAHRGLGLAYARLQDYGRAREHLGAIAARLGPTERLVLGEALLATDYPEGALAAFEAAERALLKPEERSAARRGRVRALGRLGRDEEARALLAG